MKTKNKMTEKLTLQDCLLYPKAKIKSDTKNFKNVFTFIIYSYNSILSADQILREDNLKLILRDLTQLTEEEKEYIAKVYLFDINPKRDIWEIGTLIYFSFLGGNNTIPLVNYLRSKNVMVEKKDWFAIGKAVKG